MSNSNSMSRPRVAVVIPARDEETCIGTLLDALAAQSYAPSEVIVVDAGSRDRTREEALRRAARFRQFKLLVEGPAYPGRARNLGARAANTDWLLFADCGLSVGPNCLEGLAKELQVSGRDAVCASVVPDTEGFFAECAATAYVSPKANQDPSVQLLLIRRGLYEAVGGFPEHLRSAEDLLFMNRLRGLGKPLRIAESVSVRWRLAPDLRSTYRRFRTYSYHNLKAGLGRHWQARIGVYYGVVSLLSAALLTVTRTPFLGAAPLAVLLSLRSLKATWKHRKDLPASASRQLLRVLCVAVMLLIIDVATFAGVSKYVAHLRRVQAGDGKSEREPSALAIGEGHLPWSRSS